MKKIALLAVAAALCGGGFVSTASAQIRIGTVDVKRVFDSYYKTKDAEQRVNEQRNMVKKELDDRLASFKKQVADLRKLEEEMKRPEISASARDAKQREGNEKADRLNTVQQEDNAYRQNREKELQDLSMRLRGEIVDDINRIVMERVKSEGYDLVLDRTGQSLNSVAVVLYAKDSYDFTNEMITALNKTKTSTTVKVPEPVRPTEVVRPATPVVKKPK